MLFDPDDGRTIEEIILRYWEQVISAARKAEIEWEAIERGCSWWEVVLERMDRALEELADPIAQQRFMRRQKQRELPFGKDPLLSTKGES